MTASSQTIAELAPTPTTGTDATAVGATRDKIVDLDELAGRVSAWRESDSVVVHCHGVFDLLHVGHVRHLEAAARLGDRLVVTVTPDEHVNKGPDRPAFGQQLRCEALAALECVDAVAVNRWPTAVETIATLRPHVYAKGSEYRDAERDVTGAIADERRAVEAAGGRIGFTDDITFSSSRLLNEHLPVLDQDARDFLTGFRGRASFDDLRPWLERAQGLRVLVVGETIIDEYQYCDSIGKSSKSAALVALVGPCERFAGGVIAVANNVSAVAGQVTVLTQLGDRGTEEEFVRSQLAPGVEPLFLTRSDSPTIVKRRFVESYFLTSMFELYDLNDNALDAADEERLCGALEAKLADYDLVIAVDYGHSMITAHAVDLLCAKSRFLAMNAQANAGNRGYHRLSKYPRADYVCAAQNEMFLEARDWRGDLHPVVLDVAERLDCPRVVVTCGARGALCWDREGGFVEVPALAGKVVDRVGAGDAFLSVSAPLAAAGAPTEVLAFAGNVAGAEAVATVGHRRYLERGRLAKHMQTLLA